MECMQVEEKCFPELVLKKCFALFFIEKQKQKNTFHMIKKKKITVFLDSWVFMLCVRERERERLHGVCEFISSFIPCGIFCGVILWP